MADPDIRHEGNLMCSPVSHVNFFVGGSRKAIAKLDEGMAGFPSDPPNWLLSSNSFTGRTGLKSALSRPILKNLGFLGFFQNLKNLKS